MKKFIPAVAVAALFAGSAAIAQTTAPTTPSPSPTAPSAQPSTGATPGTMTPGTTTGASGTSGAASSSDSSSMTMTEADAKNWVDKAVYGSDNKSVGEVAAVQRDSTGKVTELHADVGGFLGLGESRVRLMPAQFTLSGDRVILKVTSDQVKDLPKIAK